MQPPHRLQFDCISFVSNTADNMLMLCIIPRSNTHRIELLFNQIETRSAKKSDYMFYLSPCFFLRPLISILQQQPSKRFPVRKLRLKIFRKIWGGLAGLEDTMNMQLCAHSEGSTSLNFLNDACDASHEQNIYGEFYIWSDTGCIHIWFYILNHRALKAVIHSILTFAEKSKHTEVVASQPRQCPPTQPNRGRTTGRHGCVSSMVFH